MKFAPKIGDRDGRPIISVFVFSVNNMKSYQHILLILLQLYGVHELFVNVISFSHIITFVCNFCN